MPTQKNIEWLQDPQCAVALDPRHHPILISTWHGLGSIEVVDRYFSWTDRHAAAAIAAEERLVHIIDASVCATPSAMVRRRIYDHSQSDLIREVTMASIAVVEDPALRRLIVTAHADHGGQRPPELILVETVEQAIIEAHARLRAARIPPPHDLDPRRYQAPLWAL